ncbi:MAG: oligoribonuclease, partial [Deltaproteobacteria bacterium]|nr:oligoribonuclease [Deltaproteobacteria bacterium]
AEKKEEKPRTKKFFWHDMEMTGLDEKTDSILEVAVAVTDLDLNILEEYNKVVFQPPEALERMNKWCKKTHGASGLTKAVATGLPLSQVEEDVLQIINRHFRKDEEVVLSGNSIYNDRRFIEKYLPKIAKRLHYRMIDVSSYKEVFREKYGIEVKKSENHRALEDVREAIAELKTYLNHVTLPAKGTF